jgi:bacillithiol system protein YtxJ
MRPDVEATPLETLEALDALLMRSSERPQLVFKHSIHCGLSGIAFDELGSHLDQPDPGVDYWLVTVQTSREVSNAVEERLGIRHETPQAILVCGGRPIWNASHRRITAAALSEATAEATRGAEV